MRYMEIQLLSTVVAVSAVLYGVQAPVRAATVYTLENAELVNGWSVTGSIDFDNGSGNIVGGSVNVNEGGGDDEVFSQNVSSGPYFVDLYNSSYTQYVSIVTGTDADYADLTGNQGDAEPLDLEYARVQSAPPSTTIDAQFGSGYVTDGPSVPEPSSIIATVTAVTLGVGLRRMKRKV